MSAPDQDFTLTVTVRLYGGGTAEEAARTLMAWGASTLPLPGDREVEIIDARPASAG